ncbi:MAG: flagellar basal body-associated FliL family protein [Sporomusaceae bacterium]|nr:flagellar basal body-associated FliL family protein [Sporomusaceae bacterium]
MAEGGKKFPLAIVAGLVVVGLLLAGGISYFIANKIVAEKSTVETKKTEPGEFVKIGDPKEGLVLNVGGAGSGRFIKVGIILEVKPEKNAPPKEGKNLSPEEVKMTDTVISVLRSQKIEDFDPSKQEKLKDLIKGAVNESLGGDRVYNVFITNFVIQ